MKINYFGYEQKFSVTCGGIKISPLAVRHLSYSRFRSFVNISRVFQISGPAVINHAERYYIGFRLFNLRFPNLRSVRW